MRYNLQFWDEECSQPHSWIEEHNGVFDAICSDDGNERKLGSFPTFRQAVAIAYEWNMVGDFGTRQ